MSTRQLGSATIVHPYGHPAAFPHVTAPGAKERYLAWRRGRPRTPPLERRTVRARGLDFAVWMSPPVEDATPLLAINGGMIYGHDLLWPALSPLAAGRQLILYDQRGRGQTPAPPGARAARIEHDVLDVVALRDALGIARWDLAGHSWGGGIALLAAAEDVAGVRRVLTFDAVGATSGWLDRLHASALAHLEHRGATEAHTLLALLDPLLLHEPDPERHAEYSRTMYAAWFHDQGMRSFSPPVTHSPTGAAVAARLRREGFDWRARYAAVRAPVLLVHGVEDALPIAEARASAALIPRARVVAIPEAGHMPFFENPEPTFAAALDFPRRDRDVKRPLLLVLVGAVLIGLRVPHGRPRARRDVERQQAAGRAGCGRRLRLRRLGAARRRGHRRRGRGRRLRAPGPGARTRTRSASRSRPTPRGTYNRRDVRRA
jgi:pimeloyl-ACP methyl ester carboxylesterase